MAENIHLATKISGREELTVDLSVDATGRIISANLTAIGSLSFLKIVQSFRQDLSPDAKLDEIDVPRGNTPGHLLLLELILKVQNKWSPPYTQSEICHCRAIPTEKVIESIQVGADTPEKVSRMTSASTACGTCQPDVQGLLDYFFELSRKVSNRCSS